jgi:hypothetical protein
MSKVLMHNVVSVDGFIADEQDDVGPLFDWYFNGDTPPVEPHPRIEDELDRLAATDPGLVRSDVLRAHPDGVPAEAAPFVEDPVGALATMVEQTRALWNAALAPW